MRVSGQVAPPRTSSRKVVFFDGVCALCDSTVRFLIAIDRAKVLRFAPLQGKTAAGEPALSRLFGDAEPGLGSVVYLRGDGENSQTLVRSNAILAILNDLGGVWRLAGVLRVMPQALRDRVYDFIGRNRYRWFGQLEVCRLPRKDEEDLFLD